ncbi:transcriptional regulator [Actibacterium mucosum KCTC 23349]|uniref:Transcriptional regulator n=1 Tax=Actibacterium mucosum KCTC 23349 TaxID=1454373 RepID=A0A037ZJG9_9RHOB|nr:MarR family transcriptional regulator [Actibacterium mucosum]KAJ55707.1 transcriptional regulator [Actibacterium mucosum KCTC 23349]
MFDIEDIRAQWARQRPDIDTRPMGLIGRVVRLATIYREEMGKTFARHGMNAASFDVLATLLRSGPPHALSPNQLLATMMVTSGTMTNRIDQLEKDGLVARVPNPEDKRSVHVKLTPRGIEKIDAAITDHVVVQKRLVEGLSEADQIQLNSMLDKGLSSLNRS